MREKERSKNQGAVRIPIGSAVAFRCESRQTTLQGQSTAPALGPAPDRRPHRMGRSESYRRSALPGQATREDRLPPSALVQGAAAADRNGCERA